MLPEWGRFVTAVKRNRGLRDSNYDQLYAYLIDNTRSHANRTKCVRSDYQHTVDTSYDFVRPMSLTAQHKVVMGEKSRSEVEMLYNQVKQGRQDVADAQASKLMGWHWMKAVVFIAGIKQRYYAPMAQTMFMANLSSADPVYDEARNMKMHDDVPQPPKFVGGTRLLPIIPSHLQEAINPHEQIFGLKISFKMKAEASLRKADHKPLNDQLKALTMYLTNLPCHTLVSRVLQQSQ
ncbi:hypothetical protein Tco_0903695 [Tanacetum coccineum]